MKKEHIDLIKDIECEDIPQTLKLQEKIIFSSAKVVKFGEPVKIYDPKWIEEDYKVPRARNKKW